MSYDDWPSNCYILRLPPELRLEIYDWILARKYRLLVNLYSDAFPDVQSYWCPEHCDTSALMRTCRTMQQEVTPILYARSAVELELLSTKANPQCDHLRTCGFHQYYQKLKDVKLFIYVRNTSSVQAIVKNLRYLIDKPHLDDDLRFSSVKLTLGSTLDLAAGDLLLQTLQDVKCRVNPQFTLDGRDGSYSQHIWRDLVQQYLVGEE